MKITTSLFYKDKQHGLNKRTYLSRNWRSTNKILNIKNEEKYAWNLNVLG